MVKIRNSYNELQKGKEDGRRGFYRKNKCISRGTTGNKNVIVIVYALKWHFPSFSWP